MKKLTIRELADAKGLPEKYLRKFAIIENDDGTLTIPYYNEDRSPAPRHRIRSSVTAKEGSCWDNRSGEICPYGLWTLQIARSTGRLIIVEGESDTWTLHFHEYPAIGIPGASMANTLKQTHIYGIKTIYAVREPDGAGNAFISSLKKRLQGFGWNGHFYVINMFPDTKDPNELFKSKKDGFKAAFDMLLETAVLENLNEDHTDSSSYLNPKKPEPFPIDAFPAPIQNYIAEQSASLACPMDFVGAAVLANLSAAIGLARSLCVKSGYNECASVWVSIVAEPGSKKSPALKKASFPFFEYQKHLKQKYLLEKSQFEIEYAEYEDILKRRSKCSSNHGGIPQKPKKPVMQQLFTTDTTVEALSDVLKNNPRGILILMDELTAWVNSMNQYKNGRGSDIQTYLSLWNGSQILLNRKSHEEPTIIENPFISIVGCLPPDTLSSLSNESGSEDGFIHRILFSFPEPMLAIWSDTETNPQTQNDYQNVFHRLWSLQPELGSGGEYQPKIINMSTEGYEAWSSWVKQHNNERNNPLFPYHLKGPWDKVTSYCARFALIIHLSRLASGEVQNEAVDAYSVTCASKLVKYFKSHAARVYQRLLFSKTDKKLFDILSYIKNLGGKCTLRDIYRNGVAGCKNRSDSEYLINRLEELGHIKVEQKVPSSGGQPSIIISLIRSDN